RSTHRDGPSVPPGKWRQRMLTLRAFSHISPVADHPGNRPQRLYALTENAKKGRFHHGDTETRRKAGGVAGTPYHRIVPFLPFSLVITSVFLRVSVSPW